MTDDYTDLELRDMLLVAFPAPGRAAPLDWEGLLRLAGPRQAALSPGRAYLRPSRPRRLVIALAALAVLGAGTAIAAVVTHTRDGAPVQFSPTVGTVPFISGSPAEVLAALESRLPLVANAKMAHVTIPAEPDSTDSTATAVSGIGLSYDLLVDSTGGSHISKALWEANLFVGAVADEFTARGFGTIVEANGTLVTPNGSREVVGGGIGHVVPGQIFDAIPSDIDPTIASNAATVGLHSVQVSTLPVLQEALVIQAVSDAPVKDVQALFHAGGLSFLLGRRPADFEGVYLEIVDGAGRTVYIGDTAPRDGSGGYWAEPALGFGDQLRAHPQH